MSGHASGVNQYVSDHKEIRYVNDLAAIGFGALFNVTLCSIDYMIDHGIRAHIDMRSVDNGYADENVNIWDCVFTQPFGMDRASSEALPSYYNFDILNADLGYWALHYAPSDNENHPNRKKILDPAFVDKYRDIVRNHISVKEGPITEAVDAVFDRIGGSSVLGVHKRGRFHYAGGHGAGEGAKVSNSSVLDLAEYMAKDYDYLYLTSDHADTYDVFRQRFGDRLITVDDKSLYSAISSNQDDLNRHSLTGEQKSQLLTSLMVEMLVLSKCDYRLLTSSNISWMSVLFADDFKYSFYDRGVRYLA